MMGRTLAAVSSEHSNDTNTGQTSSNGCFSNNAPEASHDRRQPQSPSDYKQSSERGCARACVVCPKTDRRDENGYVGNPITTARRHYILCLEAVGRHRSC